MNVNATIQIGAGQIAVLFFLVAVVATMIFFQLNKIENTIKKLFKGEIKIVATLADLDAAIAAETTENATLLSAVTQLDTDVTALIAKIGQGQDFTAELNAVNANIATITGVVTSATAEDAAVQAANPTPKV